MSEDIFTLMRKLSPISCMRTYGEYDCCTPCCWLCRSLPECVKEWEKGVHYCKLKVHDSGRWCSGALKEYLKMKGELKYAD